MPLRMTPMVQLFLGIAMSLLLAALMLALATENRRWLGVTLVDDPNLATGPLRFDGLWIDSLDPRGPAAQAFRPIGALAAITGANGQRIALEPGDLVEEPDTLASYADMNAFFARQNLIAETLSFAPVQVEIDILGMTETATVWPASRRPVSSLPPAFWFQIGVGLVGFWIGLWVWTLRRREWATRFLALAGAGLMISAFPAAVYSTRELALEGGLFAVLSIFNHTGAILFGIGMIGLFMLYPRRLVAPGWLAVPVVVLLAWHGARILELGGSPAIGVHLSIVSAMATILVLVAIQYVVTRRAPRDRAALTWLGLAVVLGAGAFVITVILPHLLGLPPALSQGEAFLFFLLIYVGVALGVARYRLFQLDEWAFRILFYVAGVLLLIVIDAVLILTIVDERAPAFALSLLIVALAYLPLRDILARKILRSREERRENLFRQVMDVALTPPGKDQNARWQALLEANFQPLHVVPAEPQPVPRLLEDGLSLAVPGPDGLSDLRLDYAAGGRKLFSPRDAELAAELVAMLSSALESRAAYEKGVAEERERIARDIHDNIGVQLMGALHSQDHGRREVMIRETLTDLRDIVNNASRPNLSFAEMLADLRMQTAEHLFAAGVEMDWTVKGVLGGALPLHAAHTLRSIVREAVRNALAHGRPRRIAVVIGLEAGTVAIRIADDGEGFDPAASAKGNGLANMRARLAALRGAFDVNSGPSGTRIEARFPIESGRAQ